MFLNIVKSILIVSLLTACGGGGSSGSSDENNNGLSNLTDDGNNQPPVANAGADKKVMLNNSISIIGNGTDSDGTIKSYLWKEGNKVLASTSSFDYKPISEKKHTLTLTITDNNGAEGSDSIVIDAHSGIISSSDIFNKKDGLFLAFAESGYDVAKKENIPFYTNGSFKVAGVNKWTEKAISTIRYQAGTKMEVSANKMWWGGDRCPMNIEFLNASSSVIGSIEFNPLGYSGNSVYFYKNGKIVYTHNDNNQSISYPEYDGRIYGYFEFTNSKIKFNSYHSNKSFGTTFELAYDLSKVKYIRSITQALGTYSKGRAISYTKLLSKIIPDSDSDSDSDSINDIDEIKLGLNPNSNDSDGDGILDSVEIGDINNPTDTDGDGLINALDLDSDNDGFSDKEELEAGTNPQDANSKPTTNQPPIVNVESDKTVILNNTVTLTGTATDNDGIIGSYEWREGADVLATTASFTYTPTSIGEHNLTLFVTDDDGAVGSSSVMIEVQSVSNTSINLTNGLVGYYKFEDNLQDNSGNQNTGVTQGHIYYDNNGITGKAISTEVEGVYLPNLFQNETFTITAWCKFNTNHNEIYGNTGITVWYSNMDTLKQSFGFTPSSGNLSVYLEHEFPQLIVRNNNPNARGGGSLYYGEKQLISNKWQLVTITYKNKNINVYIDGQIIIKNKVTNNSPMGRELKIKARGGDTIDNLRIYNRILNQAEIEELYKEKK